MTIGLLALLGVLGLMVGSFLNVCIGRLPVGESVVSPGSRCPSCRAPIRWFDNVPVLSYVLLGGRCRACGATISVRYPLVEIATAMAFVIQGVAVGDVLPLLAVRLIFSALLIALFSTDLETQRLPNVLTLPGIGVGLLCSLVVPPGLAESVIGVAVGGGVLALVRWVWLRSTGVDGMGLGDAKMLAMIGAFLGWRLVIVVLFLSSLSGAVVGIALAGVQGRSMQYRLPFGAFLAVAAGVASVVGESILGWYLGFFR